jgi:type I restriction enzyme S subunit
MNKFTLSKVCKKIGSGATPRGGSDVYLSQGEIALIRSQNVYNDGFKRDGLAYITKEHAEELSNVEIEPDDILLNITGDSVARCCQVPNELIPARVNQHVAIIRPDKDKLDPRYLRYYLIEPVFQDYMLMLASGGATRNALTKGMIESFEIPAPSLSEQRAIAGVLGALDDKIEVNRRMNVTLESMARAVFRQWFVENEESENWEVGSISDLAQVTSGKRPENRQNEPDAEFKYPLFGGGGIMAYTNRFLYDFPILLTGRVGTLGVIFRMSDPCWTSDNTLILISSKPEYYLYLYFQLKQADLIVLNRGSTQPLLTQSDLQKVEIPLPPEKMFMDFNHIVLPMFAKIDANEKESRTLASLRNSLLPRLMRGEVRVKDVEE